MISKPDLACGLVSYHNNFPPPQTSLLGLAFPATSPHLSILPLPPYFVSQLPPINAYLTTFIRSYVINSRLNTNFYTYWGIKSQRVDMTKMATLREETNLYDIWFDWKIRTKKKCMILYCNNVIKTSCLEIINYNDYNIIFPFAG